MSELLLWYQLLMCVVLLTVIAPEESMAPTAIWTPQTDDQTHLKAVSDAYLIAKQAWV